MAEQQRVLSLVDLERVTCLLSETLKDKTKARERVCERLGVASSVITDSLSNMETYFGVALMEGPQHRIPTEAGRRLARLGSELLQSVEALRVSVRG